MARGLFAFLRTFALTTSVILFLVFAAAWAGSYRACGYAIGSFVGDAAGKGWGHWNLEVERGGVLVQREALIDRDQPVQPQIDALTRSGYEPRADFGTTPAVTYPKPF